MRGNRKPSSEGISSAMPMTLFSRLDSSISESQPFPADMLQHVVGEALVFNALAAVVADWFGAPPTIDEEEDTEGSSDEHDGDFELIDRIERIELLLKTLVQQRTVKEWYTIAEAAEFLGRASYTVREWARQGRLKAKKKPVGRGKGGEWLISHEELIRIQNHGLSPG